MHYVPSVFRQASLGWLPFNWNYKLGSPPWLFLVLGLEPSIISYNISVDLSIISSTIGVDPKIIPKISVLTQSPIPTLSVLTQQWLNLFSKLWEHSGSWWTLSGMLLLQMMPLGITAPVIGVLAQPFGNPTPVRKWMQESVNGEKDGYKWLCPWCRGCWHTVH